MQRRSSVVRSLLLRYFFASLVVPFFAIPFFRCFFLGCSVASPFRPPLLSRTISGTFVAYPCCFVVPLFHCSSAGGCFLCRDWYFPLPHFSPSPSQLFVCSCWSTSFGAWSLGLNISGFGTWSSIQLVRFSFNLFFFLVFFSTFFSFFICWLFSKMLFHAFPQNKKFLFHFFFHNSCFFCSFIVYLFVVFFKIFVYWKK